MIKSISLQNFQAHKNTTIDFSTGVNAIVGLSRAGKSSILRAVNWICENSPSGDNFISDWGGEAMASIEFDDGIIVSRAKGKSVNKYLLDVSGKPQQVFHGFSQGVPEAVKNALNMHDFNVRFQHQGPFLLSMTPGEVSRYLNKIARLDSIDKAISNIEATLRHEKQQMNAERANVERLAKELETFSYIPDAEGGLALIEKKQAELEKGNARYNLLVDNVEEIEEIEKLALPIRDKARFKKDVVFLESRKLAIDKLVVWYYGLDLLDETIRQLQSDEEKANKPILFSETVASLLRVESDLAYRVIRRDALSSLHGAVRSLKTDLVDRSAAAKTKPLFERAQKQVNKKQKAQERRRALVTIIDDINIHQRRIDAWLENKESLVADWKVLMPDQCPLCGAKKEQKNNA